MLHISITKKLADDIRVEVRENTLADIEPKFHWLTNLFYFNRRKYIIFINEKSLFSVLVEKKNSKKIWEGFSKRVQFWLEANEIEQKIIEAYLSHFYDLHVFKAKDKRLLGSMNEMVQHAHGRQN